MKTFAGNRLRPLFHVARTYFLSPPFLAAASGLVLMLAGAELAMPWLVKTAVDALVEGHRAPATTFETILALSGAILAVCGIQYLSEYWLNRLCGRAVYRGGARLRENLYATLQDQSVNFLAERRVGEVLTHLVTDIQNLQEASLDLMSELPFDTCVLIGLCGAMFWLNPLLAAIVVLFLAGSIVSAFDLGRRGWGKQKQAMEGTALLTAQIQEGLSAARLIISTDAGRGEQERIHETSHLHAAHMEKVSDLRAAVTPFLGVTEYAGIALVLVVGGWGMLHGRLTAGGLVAFLAYMEMAADPIARFARLMPRLQKAVVSAMRLQNFLAGMRTPLDKPGAVDAPDVRGALSAKDICFRYPSGRQPALENVGFDVAPGEKIAVIGRNGSGKSTLLDILLRLQDPDAGDILVDGINLKDIRTARWRSLIGVVPQDILLLNRSISENIALGPFNPGDVQFAGEQAGLGELLADLPSGYETIVGERGTLLSGGQRQRIAIARLFFRQPRIILLDEPTSSLDAETEAAILPALHKLCRNRTTFIVSHRLKPLEDVSRVVLLENGRLLGFDAPEEIWRRFPRHRELFPTSWRKNEKEMTLSRGLGG